MLDQRKATILRAVIRDYVKTGQPVGSQTLGQRHRLRVSAATIRNDMSVLEELGYIAQPHTSAGRVPTDLGYRWFIDNWPEGTWPDLTPPEKRAIEKVNAREFPGLEDALDSTSKILSAVTAATSVVVSPPSRKNRLRRIELLKREDSRVTVLLIADTGVVRQGVVELRGDRSDSELSKLERDLNSELDKELFEEIPATLRKSKKAIKSDRELLASSIEKILARDPEERIYRGGTANILSPNKFADLATAQEVVDALEHPVVLAGILDAAKDAQAVIVLIGNEVPIQQMRACAVVFAPYDAGHDRTGTLGVVGPTRMDYPHTISAVEAMAIALSKLLGTREHS